MSMTLSGDVGCWALKWSEHALAVAGAFQDRLNAARLRVRPSSVLANAITHQLRSPPTVTGRHIVRRP